MNNVGYCLIFTWNETPKHITLRDKSNDQFEPVGTDRDLPSMLFVLDMLVYTTA